MDIIEVLLLVGILAIFGVIIFFMIRAEYRSRDKKEQISQTLGFTSLDPSPELLQKLTGLYYSLRATPATSGREIYELHNVSQKKLPDGDMILFDLIDTSGDDNSYLENQAVAILSPQLALPPFFVFPKTDHKGTLANLANKALTWLVSQMGQPVDFSQFPTFNNRYLVSSPQPEATRHFLDEFKLRRLANTRLITIHAGENIFTCSQLAESATPLSRVLMIARIQQAQELFSIFQS